ncbi:MAG: hypothetical protein P4M09_03020 [Devosia sp.]|nr:hypothetical protein [Devosia sp.]
MPDWNSRLQVAVNGTPVTPIETFTPSYTTTITPIHSIEADNVGAIFHPQTATFTMTVKAIGANVAVLTKLALGGTKFNILLSPAKGNDWSFAQLLFRDCLITTVNPSAVVIDGVPVATFNGIVLGFDADGDVVAAS